MKSGQETMRTLHDERAEEGYAAPDSAAAGLYTTAIQYLYGEIWNRPGITTRQLNILPFGSYEYCRVSMPSRLRYINLPCRSYSRFSSRPLPRTCAIGKPSAR